LKENRSMPTETVIPTLIYDDLQRAIDWLSKFFGFSVVWRIQDHGALLSLGEGSVYIRPPRPIGEGTVEMATGGIRTMAGAGAGCSGSLLWRLDEVEIHYENVLRLGATILQKPTDEIYGERQYAVADLAGNRWVFSETIRDVDPAEWGAQGTAG
jgi:uncharacterized glyoxalase superfamily protein PhnB